MTDALFRQDAYLRETPAKVVAIDGHGIVLDRTVFYPRGGGQAGDAGVLRRADGVEIAIADTVKGEVHDIVHVPTDAGALASLAIGDPVVAAIDWERRHRHMRFHTATHLLCAVVPHQTKGCSIISGYARLGFDMGEPLEREHLERELARLVAEAHDGRTLWITEEELDAKPELVRTMSAPPAGGAGRVRVLQIDGVALQPCGGTHVANTREIGAVKIVKIEKKSARTRR